MTAGETPYRPLDISKREIRLLSLHPGPWSDDADWSDDESSSEDSSLAVHETDHDATDDDVVARCTLHTVSLDDKPEYEALSYVWGDLSKRAGVVVDGICTMVTVTLQRALRRLRLIDKPRIIWADALCINQGDIAERGHQVGMMKDVYSACTRCVIWFEEEGDFPLKLYNLLRLDGLTNSMRKKKVSAFEEYLLSQGKGTNLPPIKSKIDLHPSAKSWLDVEAAFDLVKMLADDGERHLYEMPFYQITQYPQFRICEKWQNA
ncbi:hypothetical protein E2P81_ATG00787 [Venturia nashicola]|uniref:Heterokaryon incompatibility domain-containing protein n=1 Tax=Venturia nashicola TaxID=86259 RepID=A0A4Z1PA59_9PEZI|nr:hypothetical protein E6O75_ATG00805 [Venturia nashicola]TLD38244.1 hypothetical protein E2P81_ATG00787 [Venturia nashicola]